MKLGTFLIIASVLALGYGLGLLLVPAFMNMRYGLGTSSSELLLSRFFGSELLLLGLINWMSRDFTGASARPVVTASLLGNTIGAIVALIGTLGGVMNSAGWSAVGIYLLLALGFAYFQFIAPAK